MARLLTLVLLAALVGNGCDSAPTQAPPRFETSRLDAAVAAMLQTRLDEIDDAPGDAEARGRLGLALEANALGRAAAEAYAQAESLAPQDGRWPYHRARYLADAGEVPAALEALERALQHAPDYAPAHRERGLWLLELGRLDEAAAALRRAAELDPTDAGAQIGLARVLLQQDDAAGAIALLAPRVGRTHVDAYLRGLLGRAYGQAGRLDEARVELAAAGGAPTEPVWKDPWREELERYRLGYAAEFKRAMRLAGARRFDEAIPLLERLREQRPDDVTLLANLGAAYVDTRRPGPAVETLRRALTEDPAHFGAHLNLSAAYEQLHRLDDALLHVDKAIETNPSLADAHLKRGQLLVRSKRAAEALEPLDAASRFDVGSAVPLMWSGWVRVELRRWPEAVRDFEAAIERDPADGAAHLGLALARAESGDLDGSRSALDRAEKLAAHDPRLARIRKRILQIAQAN